jgi:hypothetical protein
MIHIKSLIIILLTTISCSCSQNKPTFVDAGDPGYNEPREDTTRKELLQFNFDKLLAEHQRKKELMVSWEKEDSVNQEFKRHDQDSFYMVGVWHASDCVGSGYSDLYLFYDDGTFMYFENQMDCSNRLISLEGMWKNKSNILTLTIRKKTIWTGGKLLPVTGGSCGSDSMLVDAKEKVILLSPHETKKVTLSSVYYEEDLNRKTMKFDKTRFWRIYNNPEEFEYY